MSTSIDTYAVFGNPVEHSKSPMIHAEFARQTKQTIEYHAHLAPVDGFAQAVEEFRQAGGQGANVTVPFKQDAYQLVDKLSDRAQQAGAVNTLSLTDDGWAGDNTDGVGLVRDLMRNHFWLPLRCRILILGAGGAVRGVLGPLLMERPAAVTVANRTVSTAEELAALFNQRALNGCGFDDLAGESFDCVINAVSAGLQGEMPALPAGILKPGGFAYDMVYGNEPTVFMRWAETQGAGTVTDGLGMLVEQAAESFFIWRGVQPETMPVIQLLSQKK
ncbi:MAG: shikimate dehydrogenase [Pseudomonadota bacterium]